MGRNRPAGEAKRSAPPASNDPPGRDRRHLDKPRPMNPGNPVTKRIEPLRRTYRRGVGYLMNGFRGGLSPTDQIGSPNYHLI